MIKTGFIYKITNRVNGKVYVGQSVNGKHRLASHKSQLRRNAHVNPHLQNAFNKYGEGSFSFDIILECSVDELDEVETRMIAKEKSNKNSYNIELGGTLVKSVQPSTREKMKRITTYNHKKNKEFRKSYLKSRARKVICLNNMIVYDGLYLAGENLGVDVDAIYQVATGRNRYAEGPDGILYQFRYYEKGKEYSFEEVQKNPRTMTRKVVCANTKEVFNSVKDASEKYGVSNQNILRCCHKTRDYGGRMENGDWIIWRFIEDYDESESFVFHRKFGNSVRGKPVRCKTTGELFGSGSEACSKYNLSSGNLTSALKGKRNACGKLNNGTPLTWEYA